MAQISLLAIWSQSEMKVGKTLGIGLIAGAFGGMFGVGGGLIVVPALVLFLAFDQYRAAGTSIVTIVASSSAALAAFAVDGEVDWLAALIIFAGAGIGAWVGSRYIERIPQHVLTGLFAVFVAISAVRMWF